MAVFSPLSDAAAAGQSEAGRQQRQGARVVERGACWEGNGGHRGMDVLAGRRVVRALYRPRPPLVNAG